MKKHKILTAAVLALCIGALPIQALPCPVPAITANAETSDTIEYNGMTFETREGKSDELILTSYSEEEANLIIPEKIEGKTVTAIDSNVFKNNKILVNVTLPDTINYFGRGVFENSQIESVDIPESLRVIPDDTFSDCEKLQNVKFHDKIICISKTAFENTIISVPNNFMIIDSVEDSCSEIVNHSYIDGFKIIIYSNNYGDYFVSLLNCNLLTDDIYNMILPEEISGLPVKNFDPIFSKNPILENGSPINSITFPKYFDYINCSFLKNRSELKEINFNSSDIEIANETFMNTGIEKITLHGSCNMGKQAFYNCENLKSVTIDGNPKTIEIGNQTFQGCSSLEKIIIPDTCENIKIGRNAFENTNIKQLEINSNCVIDVDAFSSCPLESVIINSDNAEIKLDAFADCENLRELKLSKGCNFSQNTFSDCTALENINIDISESITGSAFNGCTNLTSINGEQVFDENTGDFIPEYRDFIMNNFNLADDIGFINQYVKSQVKKIVAENITPNMNDMQKVKVLHDWVCNHTSYSPAGQESHNDAAILMNDTTVCEGYSRLCNLLYHEAGIETYYVTGVNHAWNIINIDGHYFHVDSTWDDSNDEISYKWFCKSDLEMKNAGGYHASWKVAVISSLHDFQENISPECNYQMGDMNMDGELNISDAVKLEKYLLNIEKPDDNLVLSDLNFDGNTDVFDMVEIRKKVTE